MTTVTTIFLIMNLGIFEALIFYWKNKDKPDYKPGPLLKNKFLTGDDQTKE